MSLLNSLTVNSSRAKKNKINKNACRSDPGWSGRRNVECFRFSVFYSRSISCLILSCSVSHLPPSPPPPSTFLIFSPMLCTLLQKGFGHELFCWLNIFSPPSQFTPLLPPASPSIFILPSLSSSFPPSIPTASEFPNLSPPQMLLFSASSFPPSCPAKIRRCGCPGLLTLYYWAERAALQKLTIHIIPTAWGGGLHFLLCVTTVLASPVLAHVQRIHGQYFLKGTGF